MAHSLVKSTHFRVLDGLKLAADVGGDPRNPPVILQHGGGQTRHSWRPAMAELVTNGYYVINLEARGHGDSDWDPNGDYSYTTMARDLLWVIDTLEESPALVGASMGGATSLLAMAQRGINAARALVLVDFVPRIEPAGTERILDFMRSSREGFASLEEAIEALAQYSPSRRRSPDSAGLLKILRRSPDGRYKWHWDPKILDPFERLEPTPQRDALEAAAGEIRVPGLLIRGLQSDVVSDAGVGALRRIWPAVEVLNVREAGHMVSGDTNAAFNRGVIEFLRRHVSREQQ